MSFADKANVPFPIGSHVLIEDRKGVWVVWDHHGHTWPLGQDTDQVILHKVNDLDEFEYTTWDKLKAANGG